MHIYSYNCALHLGVLFKCSFQINTHRAMKVPFKHQFSSFSEILTGFSLCNLFNMHKFDTARDSGR